MKEIPVYLILGLLDSGKTTFLNRVLQDGFAEEGRTLLLCCEEGEEEYETGLPGDITVIRIDEEEKINLPHFKWLEANHQPDQVIIEYNGMWDISRLADEVLPSGWLLYQIITVADATTFDLYVKNMGALMMEKLKIAELIVFNRTDEELRAALRRRNLRMVNRRAEILLEDEEGNSEPYNDGTLSAFDLSMDLLEVGDEDYGFWYVELMDNPELYEGKQVRYKAMMLKGEELKGYFAPGRFAMVCCAEDVAFLGVPCRGMDVSGWKNREWVQVTATVCVEPSAAYQGEVGPVLLVSAIEKAEAPEEEVIQF